MAQPAAASRVKRDHIGDLLTTIRQNVDAFDQDHLISVLQALCIETGLPISTYHYPNGRFPIAAPDPNEFDWDNPVGRKRPIADLIDLIVSQPAVKASVVARITNVFGREKINTIGDLLERSEQQVSDWRNLGNGSMRQIVSALQSRNLKLRAA